ncbi:MAG: thioredoxin family protein [Chlorobia bacterium]|nr:thioredoxin family protein [Fimbriimonadaceae bacterium]
MKILALSSALVLAGSLAVGFNLNPSAEPGEAAPVFALTDTNGKSHTLSDFKGKYVVLEWLNYGCPYVQTHYESGNMPGLQKEWTKKGVVWLSIVSSAPGKQGYYEPAAMNDQTKKNQGSMTAVLLDPTGKVGKEYGAKTTPHMYVINPEGKIIYAGGIDNKAVSKPQTDPSVTNYVTQALSEAMAGKEVSVKKARPYGCGVKYGS